MTGLLLLVLAFVTGAVSMGGLLLLVVPIDTEHRDEIHRFLDEQRDELQDRYETEEDGMDYVEFGDRVTTLELPGTEAIIRDAVEADGIGPETALGIAREFDGDYEAYRAAGDDDLQRVNGVGPNRSNALLND